MKIQSTLAWALALTLAGAGVVTSSADAQQTAGGQPGSAGQSGGTGAGDAGQGRGESTQGGHEWGRDRGRINSNVQEFDRDQDRRLSAEEARALHGGTFYRDWDTDRDTFVVDREFHAGLFTTLDADASGRLERREFDELDRWGFRNVEIATFDVDRDGFVSRDEYDRNVVNVTVFGDWDRNRDLRLDVGELDAGYFTLWDEDRDGFLVEREYRPLLGVYADAPRAGSQVRVSTTPATTWVTVPMPVTTVEVERLFDEPGWFGQVVAIDAEVEQKLGPHVYAVDRDGEEPDMLVLVPHADAAIPAGTEVKIVGHVRPLIRAELERDFDWFDASWVREMNLHFDRRQPVLVASAILSEDGQVLSPQ